MNIVILPPGTIITESGLTSMVTRVLLSVRFQTPITWPSSTAVEKNMPLWVEIGTGPRVNLIERLAGLMSDALLREFPAREVCVRVRKLTAPLDGYERAWEFWKREAGAR